MCAFSAGQDEVGQRVGPAGRQSLSGVLPVAQSMEMMYSRPHHTCVHLSWGMTLVTTAHTDEAVQRGQPDEQASAGGGCALDCLTPTLWKALELQRRPIKIIGAPVHSQASIPLQNTSWQNTTCAQ